MPTVARLSIAPVRSLGLEHPKQIDLTDIGVVEDRRFYLVDDTGRLVDRLVVGELVQVSAHTDRDATRLRMEFPDGTVLDDEIRLREPIATDVYGRTAVGRAVDGPWAEALSAIADRRIRLIRSDRPGGTRDGNPASLISDGSLRELARHAGVESVDGRRFRMLIEIDGAEAHEEDTWIGSRIKVGRAVLAITGPDSRCAITTQDPDTGVRDLDTLRTLISYRGLRDGRHADFGVLADVAKPGKVKLGDKIQLLD
jgi:uncharacterized protein YcbX